MFRIHACYFQIVPCFWQFSWVWKKRQLVSNSCFRIEKDSIQYDEDNFNEKEDSISSDDDYEDDQPDFNSQTQLHDDDYEDDRPDFNSQTQLHVAVAGAKVLNRKGNKLRNPDPEKKIP